MQYQQVGPDELFCRFEDRQASHQARFQICFELLNRCAASTMIIIGLFQHNTSLDWLKLVRKNILYSIPRYILVQSGLSLNGLLILQDNYYCLIHSREPQTQIVFSAITHYTRLWRVRWQKMTSDASHYFSLFMDYLIFYRRKQKKNIGIT